MEIEGWRLEAKGVTEVVASSAGPRGGEKTANAIVDVSGVGAIGTAGERQFFPGWSSVFGSVSRVSPLWVQGGSAARSNGPRQHCRPFTPLWSVWAFVEPSVSARSTRAAALSSRGSWGVQPIDW